MSWLQVRDLQEYFPMQPLTNISSETIYYKPTSISNDKHNCCRFTDKHRYYNLLLSAWEQKYHGLNRETGRIVLEQLCANKHHLKVRLSCLDKFLLPKFSSILMKSHFMLSQCPFMNSFKCANIALLRRLFS